MEQKTRQKFLLFILSALLAFVLSVVAFKTSSIPFFLSLLFLSVPFWVLAFQKGKTSWKVAGINLGAIVLLLSMVELVFIIMEKKNGRFVASEKLERVYETDADPLLGWKLRKNTSRISRKFVNGELVYRAEISVDSNGLRVTPPCAVGCDGAVLFFGDSFTYGEGVDDSLTLPYQFSVRTGNRFRVYNFGVHGYGPQHMLAQVEGGMVDSLVNEEVKHIIYQVIYPEHIYRLMGYWSWDVNGPGYVLGKDNEVIRSGNFKRNIRRYRFQTGIMGRSAFFRRVFTYQRPLKPAEKELFVAVIKKTKTLLDAKYPGSDFHMIVWDWTNGSDSLVFNQLKDAGIKIHEKADIFPGGKVGMDCRIGPMDMHPNGRAYGIMAGYLCRILLLTDD